MREEETGGLGTGGTGTGGLQLDPLIGQREQSLHSLVEEFANHPGFTKALMDLDNHHNTGGGETGGARLGFRKVRRDGCCFYRAYTFRLFEKLAQQQDKNENDDFIITTQQGLHQQPDTTTLVLDYYPTTLLSLDFYRHLADQQKQLIFDMSPSHSAVDDFHQAYMESLDGLSQVANTTNTSTTTSTTTRWASSSSSSVEYVEQLFNDPVQSNYIVTYARLLTSAWLHSNRATYECFLPSYYEDMSAFCREEVLPMWVEADELQISALCSALQSPVNIFYLTGKGADPPKVEDKGRKQQENKQTKTVVQHVFPEGARPMVELLYRPGHYDVLYTN